MISALGQEEVEYSTGDFNDTRGYYERMRCLLVHIVGRYEAAKVQVNFETQVGISMHR